MSNPQPKTRGFSGYDPDLEQAVFDFQREEYSSRPQHTVAPNWRWMFVESAARLGVKPSVWLYLKNGDVVAHQGAIPVRLRVRGEELTTGWFVETMAGKAVRGSPIGPMLIKKALEEMPLNLSLGQTQQMRELQFALGWRQVCPLVNLFTISGYSMSLRNRLPRFVASLAAFGTGLFYAARWRRKRAVAARGYAFRTIERFTAEHDALWRQMAQSLDCAVVRDSSYLNWKYVDRPFASFIRLEMCDDEGLKGIVVLMVKEPGPAYAHRRGFIVDCVVPLQGSEHAEALVARSVDILREHGAQTVTFHVAGARIIAAAKTAGFFEREPRYHFLIATGGAVESTVAAMSEPANWFLTLGDSDTDAYGG